MGNVKHPDPLRLKRHTNPGMKCCPPQILQRAQPGQKFVPPVARVQNVPTAHSVKHPVAPPVYRPQPKPIQQKRAQNTPVVYKPGPGPNARGKPVSPRIVSPPKNALPRPATLRPATFIRPHTVQLYKVKEISTIYKVQPEGDQELTIHRRVRALLVRDDERDIGDDLNVARSTLASLVLERLGGQTNRDYHMIAYFLGVEKERPAARVFGLGSLSMSDDGRLHGRPGFLRSSFRQDEDRGRPGRAYRHRSAWHNLKILLNAIQARYGEREIDYLYDRVRRGVSAETIAEADKLLSRFQGTEVRRRLMWLAVIINSAPSNLWLGPSKENTSINTVAYHLNRWLSALDKNELEVEQFKLKVEGGEFGCPKARSVQAEILKIIADSAGQPDRRTYIVNEVKRRGISRLEIDLPNEAERAAAPHHMRIFEIANDIGGLGDRRRIIEALLELQHERSRSPSPDRGDSSSRARSRSRSRSPSPPPLRPPPPRPLSLSLPSSPSSVASSSSLASPIQAGPWGAAVNVPSMEAAAARSWNAGDTFRLPDGRRFGLRFSHFGGAPFVQGDLWLIVGGG